MVEYISPQAPEHICGDCGNSIYDTPADQNLLCNHKPLPDGLGDKGFVEWEGMCGYWIPE